MAWPDTVPFHAEEYRLPTLDGISYVSYFEMFDHDERNENMVNLNIR